MGPYILSTVSAVVIFCLLKTFYDESLVTLRRASVKVKQFKYEKSFTP